MRFIALTALALSAAAPAFASSIETIDGPRLGNNSMVTVPCADCPPPRPAQSRSSYMVPVLEGVQKEEIREVNGERMIMRTDRWMGGSPTVFYQKLTPQTEAAMGATPAAIGASPPVQAGMTAPDGIDATATTAAVSADPAAAEDFSRFELRLR